MIQSIQIFRPFKQNAGEFYDLNTALNAVFYQKNEQHFRKIWQSKQRRIGYLRQLQAIFYRDRDP